MKNHHYTYFSWHIECGWSVSWWWLLINQWAIIIKKHFNHTTCDRTYRDTTPLSMRFSGTTEHEWTTLSMRFSGVVCTVTTNNSPYTEKWGVQSRSLQRNVCLFECYPQKDVNVLRLPTVGCFCLRFTHRKSPWLCCSVTHTESCCCLKVTHIKI